MKLRAIVVALALVLAACALEPRQQQPPNIIYMLADDLGYGELGSYGQTKIRTFEKARRHEDNWSRTPNTTGQGAIHVRTFHCKLTDDALTYLDQCVNEWLDAHPQYEVKFVTSSVGTLTGKLKEPNLICQVWV